MGVCNSYVDKSHLLSPVMPIRSLPFRKAEENLGFMSRNDECYPEKHIGLLPSVKQLQQVIITSTIYLFVDTEVRMWSSDSDWFVSD